MDGAHRPGPFHLYPPHTALVHNGNPPASLLLGPLPRPSPTSSSVCRQVPGPSKGATMSLVTGSLLGKLERQWSMTGLTPFRYWYPKKLSSHQCSVTYSGGVAREGTSRSGNYLPNSGPAQPFAPHYGFSPPPTGTVRGAQIYIFR